MKSRAAPAGMSLSDYLLAGFKPIAERPTMEEMMARLRSRPAPYNPAIDTARAMRNQRAARDLSRGFSSSTRGRFVRPGLIDEGRGRLAMDDLALMQVRHHPLLPRVWALRHNPTACDATPVALDATLPTRDARLAQAAPTGAGVEVI